MPIAHCPLPIAHCPLPIAEYWIIDPIQERITVLSLVAGLYEEAVFAGDAALAQLSVGIASQLLSELGNGSSLTAIQVLQGTNQ